MKIRKLLLLTGMFALFFGGLNGLEATRAEQGRLQLEQAVRRSAVSCYANEGFYPPDVGYMTEHCGLRYDRDLYEIRYEIFASNWMPEITVLEKKP